MTVVMDRAWREENKKRTERLNLWYKMDNRDDPEHAKSDLYTGLYEEILIYEKWNKRFAPMA
jgi:hypothetical protein